MVVALLHGTVKNAAHQGENVLGIEGAAQSQFLQKVVFMLIGDGENVIAVDDQAFRIFPLSGQVFQVFVYGGFEAAQVFLLLANPGRIINLPQLSDEFFGGDGADLLQPLFSGEVGEDEADETALEGGGIGLEVGNGCRNALMCDECHDMSRGL